MIGKPEWFERRKYGGWGLHPKNWKGWTYTVTFMIILLGFHLIPFWSTLTRTIFTGVWALILIIDTLSIMAQMNLDEREKIHEAFAERNALWGVLAVLIIGFIYEAIKNGLQEKFYVNPFIAAAIIVGLIIKAASNIYLDKKN